MGVSIKRKSPFEVADGDMLLSRSGILNRYPGAITTVVDLLGYPDPWDRAFWGSTLFLFIYWRLRCETWLADGCRSFSVSGVCGLSMVGATYDDEVKISESWMRDASWRGDGERI